MAFRHSLDDAHWTDAERTEALVAGWLFEDAGRKVRGVRVRVPGGQTWSGRHGERRGDVAAAFPECARAEESGFSLRLEGIPPRAPAAVPWVLEASCEPEVWEPIANLDPAGFTPRITIRHEDDVLGWEDCRRLHGLTAALASRPLLSVVMPTYNTPPDLLRAAVDSVRNQLYERWELCVADDASPAPHVRAILEDYARRDSRIRVVLRETNGNISAATNSALALAQGEFVALLDHDDELTPDALAAVAFELDAHPETDLLYTDQDKKDAGGRRTEPFFKPDWSPEYLRGVMYVGHLLVVRRQLLERVGGFDPRFDGVQDYEATLRLTEATKPERIRHLPKILYHWRMAEGSIAAVTGAKGDALARRHAEAVDAQLARLGLPGRAVPATDGGHRVRIAPAARTTFPKIALLVPTRDAPDYLNRCLESIFTRTTYPNFEVILGDNDTKDPRALAIMAARPEVRRVPCPGPFNYSRVNNRCAREAAARGAEFLVLLNNDTEVVTADWLEQILFLAEQPDVGAVGPLLIFPGDGGVQHAGVILGPRGTADHLMRGFPPEVDGYAGSLTCSREVSVVTAACLMVRRSLYEEVGGLEEHFATHYQDIDFCLQLRARGRRNLFTPNARLVHHESASRRAYYDLTDRALLLDRWEDWIERGDPYHNPNFDPRRADYRVALRPRANF